MSEQESPCVLKITSDNSLLCGLSKQGQDKSPNNWRYQNADHYSNQGSRGFG
nr:MAG TPA: hypothetical protein [Caudoviricetes sp.]